MCGVNTTEKTSMEITQTESTSLNAWHGFTFIFST